jgi:hypothetical protein
LKSNIAVSSCHDYNENQQFNNREKFRSFALQEFPLLESSTNDSLEDFSVLVLINSLQPAKVSMIHHFTRVEIFLLCEIIAHQPPKSAKALIKNNKFHQKISFSSSQTSLFKCSLYFGIMHKALMEIYRNPKESALCVKTKEVKKLNERNRENFEVR